MANFRMEAASRMKTKANLAAFLVPVTQLLFNPQTITLAQQSGKTIDFEEWSRFMQDATGTARSYDFFRDMEPQEQQQLPPTPAQAKMAMEMQKMQQQSQTSSDDRGENSALQILQALIKERMTHFENRMDRDTLQSTPASNSSDQLAENDGQ
jgi:hypothetical protein